MRQMTVFSKPQDSPGHAFTQTHVILLPNLARHIRMMRFRSVSLMMVGFIASIFGIRSIQTLQKKQQRFSALVGEQKCPYHKINVPIMVPIMSPLSLRSA